MLNSENRQCNHAQFALGGWLVLGCGLIASCVKPGDGSSFPPAITAVTPSVLEVADSTFLSHMPMNSDQRCVGIALVAEALFAGQRLAPESMEPVEALAERVYGNVASSRRLEYPAQLQTAIGTVSIDSAAGLSALTEAVANRYKQQYFGDVANAEGQARLRQAIEQNLVRHEEHLRELLRQTGPHPQAFFGMGFRLFPNDDLKETWHAFLIGLEPTGEFYVLDSNDWGPHHTCHVREDEDRVLIEWSCKYRDTGETTSQEYQIATKRVLSHTTLQGSR